MTDKLYIVGIGGSYESKSIALASLKFTLNEVKKLGCITKLYDIRKLNLPIYNPSKVFSQERKQLEEFINNIRFADGLILSSPEYHGTISGLFKNVIDYLELLSDDRPPYISNKPVGLIATGGGDLAGVSTLQTMINIVHNLRGVVASNNVAISSAQKHFDINSNLVNDKFERRLKRLAEEVNHLAYKLK